MYTGNVCSDSKYLVQVQRHESTLTASLLESLEADSRVLHVEQPQLN